MAVEKIFIYSSTRLYTSIANHMQITIKRLDPKFPLPAYHTAGAAAFDFYAREEMKIPPHTLARIPTNLVIATPEGYALIIAARSSLAHKKGLMLANGIGVIDSDYRGDDNEILISVYNFTDTSTVVERGDRLAQGMFIKVAQAEWHETLSMTEENRGNFGSTGLQ